MKNRNRFVLLTAIIFMAFAFCLLLPPGKTAKIENIFRNPEMLSQERDETQKQIINMLPSSLQDIGDEAFEGTALGNIQLPESVATVGDRAFADNKELQMVRFPEKLELLGKNVFAGSDHAVLDVFAGSDVMIRAMEEGYRFRIMTAIARAKAKKESLAIAGSLVTIQNSARQRGICSVEEKEQRTGRTDAELKAEKSQGIASVYIQSRYFP